MADNITLDAGSGGATLAAASLTVSGDTAVVQMVGAGLLSGSEGSWTLTQLTGGSGVTDAGTLRVTLATDVALPAGTNAIGKLAANSGVDIGDVDVTSVVPGTGATNLGKAEDAAHSSGDVGVAAMTVRQDTAAALSGTDGDYQPLITDGSGRLHVNVGNTVTVGSHAVTNAGTFAVQVDGAALTSLQLIDDAVFSDDAAYTPGTSKLLVIGAQADEDSTDSVDEGDAGALRMTLERRLRVVSALDSAAMQSGNDQVTPKFAVIAASSSGDNTLVSAVASKKIRVLSYVLVANAAVNAKFQSATAGDLTGLLYCAANTGASSGFSPVGHFQTAANEDLQLNLSGAVAVGGHLTYIEVD